jgi:hypothetical protein
MFDESTDSQNAQRDLTGGSLRRWLRGAIQFAVSWEEDYTDCWLSGMNCEYIAEEQIHSREVASVEFGFGDLAVWRDLKVMLTSKQT